MKTKIKAFSLTMCLLLTFIFVVACNPEKELKRVSKNLSAYNICAELDKETMTVNASEKVHFYNSYNVGLNEIFFNLYGKAFREDAKVKPYTTLNEGKCFPNGKSYGDIIVSNVRVEKENVNYEYAGEDSNALKINLNKIVEPKEFIDIEFDFELKLANCVHRLGYYNNHVNLGNWFPILAKYEMGEFIIEPYFSTGDPFYSDLANYTIEFTYPEEYILSSSGEEKSIKCKESIKKDKIIATAVRDFAVFLSEENEHNLKKINDINIIYSGYENDENAQYCLSVATKAVKYFSETFGRYPYKSLEIIKAPFLHGGMEYPGAVIISDSIKTDFDIAKVIVHEIAHQWWYAVVGNNQIKEAWLDESLAEYSTILFFENHKEFDASYEELISEAFANYTLFADIASTINKKINTNMLLKVNEYNSEYEYSYMIYVRGVLMFDSIRSVVGKECVEKALRKYFSKYKFKIAKTDDLIEIVNRATKKNVDVVMDSWLKGKTVIGEI